jgi:hypothetical protein
MSSVNKIPLTKKDIQYLGLTPSLSVSQNLGFTDNTKSAAESVKQSYLDLENAGTLKSKNPKLVIREIDEDLVFDSAEIKSVQSWRQASYESNYFARYQAKCDMVGQLSDIDFTRDYYPYKDNNFFKPWRSTKILKRLSENDFSWARFRFPPYASNTKSLTVQSRSGEVLLTPFFELNSKEELRKSYYRWFPNLTRNITGKEQSPYDNKNLSGFNIPYPNTIYTYNAPLFNVPVKIAPKFNDEYDQSLNGIIVISTGSADYKNICYVSPHSIDLEYLNSVEDIYEEKVELVKVTSPGTAEILTLAGSSWYGSGITGSLDCGLTGYRDNLNGQYKQTSIPSQNRQYKRFSKINEPNKQIYFNNQISTPYGSGAWAICLSGNANLSINTGQRGVVYVHQPNSLSDWQKTDPRKLSGPWKVASGILSAASPTFLNRASTNKPQLSSYRVCRRTRNITTKRLQLPSIVIDSKYTWGGHVLPRGLSEQTRTVNEPVFPFWTTTSDLSGDGLFNPISNIPFPIGNEHEGYIIGDAHLTLKQIADSGIQIPTHTVTYTDLHINNNDHFIQSTPLKDTYFYKFYNQLHKNAINTGTWNGIIPSGVRFSVELISTTLNNEIGIKSPSNISVFYSGYGSNDIIDRRLRLGISNSGARTIFPDPQINFRDSGVLPWVQNRSPFRHTFNQQNQLVYSSYKAGPTKTDAKSITRILAIKNINSKILQIVNKLFPNLTYKNKKWKKLQKLKSKLAWIGESNFDVVKVKPIPNNTGVPRRTLQNL